MKILVAVDGSSFTKRMLGYLTAHDEWLGGAHAYTLLHVVPGLPPRAAAVVAKDTVDSYYRDEAEKVFKPLRAFFGKRGLAADFRLRHGHAGDVIAQEAEKGRFDLVMLGSHGHGALASLVLGSTANRVVSRCGVPVLLVR
jgi:nucleotide-binding universal stress UspA family protein